MSLGEPVTCDFSHIRVLGGEIEVSREFILRQCYARHTDIVLAAGTLIEGIGNAYSDIDVYVLTDRLRSPGEVDSAAHHRVLTTTRDIVDSESGSGEVYLIHTVIPGTGVKVDVEFLELAAVERLLERASRIFDYASTHPILLTKLLAEREKSLIHRLYNAIALQGDAALKRLTAMLPSERYCYLGYRWLGSDYSVLLDIMGAWRKGEEDRVVDLARENLITQMSAYLCLLGVTNLQRKWFLTYLDAYSAVLGALADDFKSLFFFGPFAQQASKLGYVEATLNLVDGIFEAVAVRLADYADVPSGAAGLAMLDRDRRVSDHSGYSDLEFEYRAKIYGRPGRPTRSYLARFGEGGVALALKA